MLRLALVLCGAQALLAPVTQTRRNKMRIRGFFDGLMDKFDGGRVEPPPPMQAFLAGASPQAQKEYAALQDAFPVGASEDVQLEWRAFEQVFAGRQASGSSETAWAQQEAFEVRGEVYALEPHAPDQLVAAVRRNGRGGVARLPRAVAADKARALRDHVLRVRDGSPLVGDILGPSDNSIPNAPQTRWDVFMDPADPEVASVVQELLTGPVGAAFAELCGPDAVLRECSAVVSAPGSPPQPCHSDTKWTEDLVLATCFVALQDIDPELGPTRFLPATATAKAHALLADALAAPDAAAAERYEVEPILHQNGRSRENPFANRLDAK